MTAAGANGVLDVGQESPASDVRQALTLDAVGPVDPERFSDPPRESRPAVLWFLNGHLTEQLISEQLQEMRSVGIYRAVLFAYQGGGGYPRTTPPYLSEGWFELIGHALREAQRTGMTLWLFDDEFFPSGRAGGRAVHAADNAPNAADPRPRQLHRLRRTVTGPTVVDLAEIPPGTAPDGLDVSDGWLQVAADGLCLVHQGTDWRDYVFSFTSKPLPAQGHGQAGWLVRAGDHSAHAWSLREGSPGSLAYLPVWNEANRFTRLTPLPFDVEPGRTYRIRVVAEQKLLQVFIDGVLVDEVDEGVATEGGVGFFREQPDQRALVTGISVDSLNGSPLYRQSFDGTDPTADFAAPVSSADVVAVVALRTDHGRTRLQEHVDLTEAYRQGGDWTVPAGNWELQYFQSAVPRCVEPYREFMPAYEVTDYVDPMSGSAVDQLIDCAYEEYYRRFPWAFGDVLSGFWNDEPVFAIRWPDSSRDVIWSDSVRDAIEDLGGSLAGTLPALFTGFGDDGRRARARYWRAVSTLLADTYYRKLAEWADRRGVAMASNPFGDGCGPTTCLPLGGNLLKNNQWFQVPGCDTVHPWMMAAGTSHRAQAIVARHASSPAHQMGRRWVLVENMGAYGAGVPPRQVRFINGAFAVRGANFSVLHAFHVDRDPASYRHKPPLDPSSTWWAYMDDLVGWIGRVMEANQGPTGLRTAVVSPQRAAEAAQWLQWQTTMRQYEIFARGGGYNSPVDRGMHDVVAALEDAQVDLDLLDEGALDGDQSMSLHAEIQDGSLRVGTQSYRLIVIPPAPCIALRTVQTLVDFVRAGGFVAAVGDLPHEEADGRDGELAVALGALFDAAPDPGPGPGRLAGRAVQVRSMYDLQSFAREVGVTAVALDPPDAQLRVLRRVRGGDRVYLLFNEGTTRIEATATFGASGSPQLWDPTDGSRRRPARCAATADRTSFPLSLEPSAVLVVVFPATDTGEALPVAAGPLPAATGPLPVAAGPLPAAAVPLPVAAGPGERLTAVAAPARWRFRFSEDEPWREMPLGCWTRLDPTYSGSACYEQEVELSDLELRAGHRVILDLGDVREVAEVNVNGEEAGRLLWPPYRLDVTDQVRFGTNTITVKVTNTPANALGTPEVSGLLGPVVLHRAEKSSPQRQAPSC